MPQSSRQLCVNWDITYACPLRCTHCYSESGRRAARQLGPQEILRVVDALIAARIRHLAFGGGEPTGVAGLDAAAARLRAAGIHRFLFTGGFLLTRPLAQRLVPLFSGIHVSIDGACAATHDRVRGRRGSFDKALDALRILSDVLDERRARQEEAPLLALEFTAVRSNFSEIEAFCRTMDERFPSLNFIAVGPAVPSGLASRVSYLESELVSDEQIEILRDAAFAERLRRVVRTSTNVNVTDNWWLLHPSRSEEALVQMEPDGAVRALPAYEGTVGNLIEEPLEAIWERAEARHRDPYVVGLLSKVSTMREWSEAARAIDQRFAAPADLIRIARRGDHLPSRVIA